ncbi:uncharacterized protein [Palaemon carinicauda]|uniref:uncharacterized protein n=1 Tax=Palaemon carinicauda TaxID=392227 RepID=UPI0035B586B4
MLSHDEGKIEEFESFLISRLLGVLDAMYRRGRLTPTGKKWVGWGVPGKRGRPSVRYIPQGSSEHRQTAPFSRVGLLEGFLCGNMNAFRVLSLLAVVAAVYCSSSPDPILTTHGVTGHNFNPLGIHKFPLAPIHHAPAVSVAHHAPALSVAHHAPALSVAHHAPAVAVAHHAPVVAVSHHAPVTVSHSAPVAVSHHAGIPTLAVRHHGSPAVAVSHPVAHHAVAPVVVSDHHHAPTVSVSHAPVTHVKSGGYIGHSAPAKSQYHSQDELGQYAFGYNAGTSTRDESRDAYGNVRGSYSYVDPYGKLQTQHYVADGNGFRVKGTNLPVHVNDATLYRHKRSYATFPASTGPLVTVDHVGPIVHSHTPVVHRVSHVVQKPTHVVHKIAPVVHKVAPVVHKIAPVVHKVAPVVHKVAPVVHNVAPVYGVAPVVHGVAAPVAVSHAGILPYGFPYHRSAYGSYGHPIIPHHPY